MLTVALLLALATAEPIGAEPASAAPASTSVYSDCVLSEIARREGTTPEKLSTFSKGNAQKAMSMCQSTRRTWASALDRQLAADPKYQDPRLRNAQVNQVVSTDEMAVMMMVNLKAK
jgi:hypothetical protein